MTPTIAALLDRLKNTPVIDLLAEYDHPAYSELWDQDPEGPRLYRAVSRALVAQGHSWLALKLARRGLEHEQFSQDPALNYTTALAYARGGNIPSAEQRLAPLLDAACADGPAPAVMPPKLRVDVVALRGRLYKDLCQRAKDPAHKRELAIRSAEWYERAGDLPQADGFPLVNAATMRRVAGDAGAARVLASRVVDRTVAAAGSADDYWLSATLGEAHLLLGEHDKALEYYRAAVDHALKKAAVGDLVSVLGNLRLLADIGATAEANWLREQIGNVVVFSGHRIDPPHRAAGLPPRFPNDPGLIHRVRAAIRDRLRELNARFGFCSLASGSDVLFAEAMLDRGGELHVVLPLARADFLATSVDYGQVDDVNLQMWRHRFEAVLGQLKPDHLHYATTEAYLGTDLLFDYANTFVQGMGVIRARQCLVEPVALVVLDPMAGPTPGGTGAFLESWKKCGLRGEVIDLAALRGDMPAPRRKVISPVPAAPRRYALARVIRAMLFADVASFSKMDEEQAPKFFEQFPQAVAKVIAAAGERVLLANTWGDGVFAVFERVADCSAFALDFLEAAGREVDWNAMGFPDANPLRVGLHAGPVYEAAHDPILHRRNFFGQHVNRAARIEPVTVAGCAFASEQFAALLTMEAPGEFRCEVIGVEQLPKKSGVVALYRLARA